MNNAPIIIFVYNRPECFLTLAESLKTNPEYSESVVYIFSDGGKNEQDWEKVNEVRQYIHSLSGCKSVHIVEQPYNLGLASSIIQGVTKVLEQNDKVIVLEDDLTVAPTFLYTMNNALNIYADVDKIAHVCGHTMTLWTEKGDYYFIRHIDSYGWGTWKRAWNLMETDGQKLLNQLKERNLCKAFDMDGAYPFTRMLQRQIQGKTESWAIRWRASCFLADKLSISVGRSLVHVGGWDGSGTNCGKKPLFPENSLYQGPPLHIEKQTDPVETLKVRNLLHWEYLWYNSKIHKGLLWLQVKLGI